MKRINWSLFSDWSPELAWWLGVLYGDGNLFRKVSTGTYRVSAVGSKSTSIRWSALLSPDMDPQEFKRSRGTYQTYLDSKEFLEFIEMRFGLKAGPKACRLFWPQELPQELEVHFIRGLFDSDGSLSIEVRKKGQGNPSPRTSYCSATQLFVPVVKDRIIRVCDVPDVALVYRQKKRIGRRASEWWTIGWGGSSAVRVVNWVYRDAPEHIRNEDRWEVYQQINHLAEFLEQYRCPCGKEASMEGLCKTCWWDQKGRSTGDGTQCTQCGSSPVFADTLCSACYHQHRRASPDYVRPSSGPCEKCGAPAHRRNMCDRCYSAWYRGQKKPSKIIKICTSCSERPAEVKELCQPCYKKFVESRVTKVCPLCGKEYHRFDAICPTCTSKQYREKVSSGAFGTCKCGKPVHSSNLCKSCYDKRAYAKKTGLDPDKSLVLPNVLASAPVCIWHPIGSHVGESFEEIIKRKQKDIRDYGFTLWSVSKISSDRLTRWKVELLKNGVNACPVACTSGGSSKDPWDGVSPIYWMGAFSKDRLHWEDVPHPKMCSYHREKDSEGIRASAFYVTKIETFSDVKVERPAGWLNEKNEWDESLLPSRGNHLSRIPTASLRGPNLVAVMIAADPFVVWVR